MKYCPKGYSTCIFHSIIHICLNFICYKFMTRFVCCSRPKSILVAACLCCLFNIICFRVLQMNTLVLFVHTLEYTSTVCSHSWIHWYCLFTLLNKLVLFVHTLEYTSTVCSHSFQPGFIVSYYGKCMSSKNIFMLNRIPNFMFYANIRVTVFTSVIVNTLKWKW